MSRNRLIAFAICLSAVGLLVVAGMLISAAMRIANDMSDAEVRSHTTVMMATVIAGYMRDHDGRWPTSWDDLKPYPAEWGGIRVWPDNEELIRQEVAIDFDADPTAFSDDPDVLFTAIQPQGVSYGFAVWQSRWWVMHGWSELEATQATIPP